MYASDANFPLVDGSSLLIWICSFSVVAYVKLLFLLVN